MSKLARRKQNQNHTASKELHLQLLSQELQSAGAVPVSHWAPSADGLTARSLASTAVGQFPTDGAQGTGVVLLLLTDPTHCWSHRARALQLYTWCIKPSLLWKMKSNLLKG